MAHVLRESRTAYRDPVVVEDEYDRGAAKVDHGTNTVARIINIIGGLLVALLGLRFVFMLLGANQGSGIVDFVYTLSRPFVAPFFGMFNYQEQFGRSRFEFETLIAMAVYALITWALVRLVTVGNRRVEV